MKSEEDELFDDFLRKAVGNYKAAPPPAVWQKLLQRLPVRRIGRFPTGNLNTGLIALITGGAMLTSLLIYQWTSQRSYSPSRDGTAGSLSAQTIPTVQQSATTETAPGRPKQAGTARTDGRDEARVSDIQPENKPLVSNSGKTPLNNNAPGPGASHTSVASRFLSGEPVLLQDKTEKSFIPDFPDPVQHTATVPSQIAALGQNPGTLSFIRNDLSYFLYLGIPLTDRIRILPDPFREKPRTMKLPRMKGSYLETEASWSAGLYYYPEWLSNSGITKYAEIRQSGGLSVTWKKSVFSFETGLGIMKEDAFQYYDYQFNELIGTYNDLVSISFDTTGGQVIPTFIYKTDSVFDPVQQTLNKKNPASYTYLQIPVLLGIERTIGRNGLSLRTGPVLSFEVSGKEELYIPGPDMKVLSVGGDHGSRMQTTWQWYVGLGYQYYITDKFRFFLEPALRTYLNSPYNRSLNKKENPLFLGIRAGFNMQLPNALRP